MLQALREWVIDRWNWPWAAAFSGICLLAILPVAFLPLDARNLALVLVFVQLPIYMVHQFEEHAGDRFRLFVNQHIGGGYEVLSRPATFVINSVGVWGIDLLGLYLAVFLSPGWGLMAIWLTLINAFAHIGQGVAMGRYNPGLVTAVTVFLPVGAFSLWYVCRETVVTGAMQVVGIGVAVLVHVAIVIHVKRRLTLLRKQSAAAGGRGPVNFE